MQREATMNKLEKIADKEKHHHKQVWVKEPHNGPYRCLKEEGYDALTHAADGTPVNKELGYEKPQLGLTTNFVGNHMTQGAIDLCQQQLSKKDREHELNRLNTYQCTYHPPKLLHRDDGEAPSSTGEEAYTYVPFQTYTWQEADGEISVNIQHDMHGEPKVTHQVTEQSLFVEARDEEGHICRRLRIPKLFGKILPHRCTCVIRGNKIVVTLPKEDAQSSWTFLAAEMVEAALPSAEKGCKKPDLALLRKAIRTQRKNKQAGDGMLYVPLDQLACQKKAEDAQVVEEEIDKSILAALQGCCVEDIAREADGLIALGDFHRASQYLSYIVKNADDSSRRGRVLLKRSECFSQMGHLRRAIADLKVCVELEGEADVLQASLLALSRHYEMLERYETSTEYIQRFLAIHPGHREASLSLSRLQSAMRKVKEIEDQESALRGDGDHSDLLPSIPRAVPPQFENRGKSGAVF